MLQLSREGYKEYISNSNVCSKCEFLHKCTDSKNNKKVVSRHVWEEYLEEAEHLRHTNYNKKVYALRSQTIERVFADLKEKHGLRYTTLRGIDKVRMQTLLAFACLNLKKLANWKWKNSKSQLFLQSFLLGKCIFTNYRIFSHAS
ncbi:transposase [Alkalithermobacter paradoxus]|uniref:transposase n=1 Tax=Alkalithermobacter paradoxus TaxID=29349 RepID=UPI0009A5385F